MYGAHIRIEFHPTYADQFSRLVDDPDTLEVAGEVNGLVVALEEHGRLIEHTEINRIETQTIPQWERMHPAHRARIRRTR